MQLHHLCFGQELRLIDQNARWQRTRLVQLDKTADSKIAATLADTFRELLSRDEWRKTLGSNALAVMSNNRGATERTIEYLTHLITPNAHP